MDQIVGRLKFDTPDPAESATQNTTGMLFIP